jgi:hypothetical protein
MAYFGKLVVQLNQPKTPLHDVWTAANIERYDRELSKSGPLSIRVLVAQIVGRADEEC